MKYLVKGRHGPLSAEAEVIYGASRPRTATSSKPSKSALCPRDSRLVACRFAAYYFGMHRVYAVRKISSPSTPERSFLRSDNLPFRLR